MSRSLIWYLENIFYNAAGKIISFINQPVSNPSPLTTPLSNGLLARRATGMENPNVRVRKTLKVADSLRESIINGITWMDGGLSADSLFKGVDTILAELREKQLYSNLFIPGHRTNLTKKGIWMIGRKRDIVIHQHNSLFQHLVDNPSAKFMCFGLHFASLDVRQEKLGTQPGV